MIFRGYHEDLGGPGPGRRPGARFERRALAHPTMPEILGVTHTHKLHFRVLLWAENLKLLAGQGARPARAAGCPIGPPLAARTHFT